RPGSRCRLFCLQRGIAPNVLLRDCPQYHLRGKSVANRDPQSLGSSVLAFCPDDNRRIMVGQTRSATGPRTTKIVLSRGHRFFLSAPLHILAFGFKAGFPAVLSAVDADDRMP